MLIVLFPILIYSAKKKLKDELAVPIDLVNHQVVDDSDEFDNQKTNMLPNQEE